MTAKRDDEMEFRIGIDVASGPDETVRVIAIRRGIEIKTIKTIVKNEKVNPITGQVCP